MRPIHAVGWRWIRIGALTVYAGVLLYFTIFRSVPTARLPLACIIVTGLLLTRLGQGWRRLGQVLVDWAPFTAVLLLYDRTRGIADSLGIPLHESDIVHAERWTFGGIDPTVWLQNHLYDSAHPLVVHWYDGLCTLVYTSHFLATPIVAAILWLRARRLWIRYITRVIILSFSGLLTYVLFPEAPPWLAAKDGDLAPVARLSTRGWIWLHAGNVNTTLAKAQTAGSNAVAAMPSLHTAFATLIALFIGSLLTTRWRYLLVLYPMAMAFTLVYTGEHYVLDCVAGVLYALAVHFAVSWWERRRAARGDDPAAEVAEPTSLEPEMEPEPELEPEPERDPV
ncbi:phosphatase PAP2 family protein [uncultured Jatrophihabitans sp.]|uniref:phosphatase PAP2 family protein n=1 Tax=uncultured Jatrophihabitans sp. TaxID=1610747 RepID=UPI0035C9A35C